jgi:hypothetical protein
MLLLLIADNLLLVYVKFTNQYFFFINDLFVNLGNITEKAREISTKDKNENNHGSGNRSSSHENDEKQKKSNIWAEKRSKTFRNNCYLRR